MNLTRFKNSPQHVKVIKESETVTRYKIIKPPTKPRWMASLATVTPREALEMSDDWNNFRSDPTLDGDVSRRFQY